MNVKLTVDEISFLYTLLEELEPDTQLEETKMTIKAIKKAFIDARFRKGE